MPATPGREGELIFRYVAQHALGAKQKPVRRLWLQSMTATAIRDGFAPPAHRPGNAAAGRCRALPLGSRLADRHQRHACHDGLQFQGRRLLQDPGGPRADADAGDHGRTRKSASVPSSRATTGKWKANSSASPVLTAAAGSTRKFKKADDEHAKRRTCLGQGHAPTPCARNASASTARWKRTASPRPKPARCSTTSPALQREANGRFGFSCQEHAGAGPGAVRKAQGADLPADRQPPPARGLYRHGQGNPRQRWRARPTPPLPARS